MKIGMIGCGKLGLVVALAINLSGHEVFGYDVNPNVRGYLERREIPFREEGIEPFLANHAIQWCDDIYSVVEQSDIIFVAVQTPHDERFEGTLPITDPPEDFDYSFLVESIEQIAETCEDLEARKTVAVISTALPGTFDREIAPILNEYVDYAHTPQFIAMGTVIEDYLFPEFNLIGAEDPAIAKELEAFFATINDAPCVLTDVTTAEGAKLSYNTWVSAKTVIANAWGELSERLGMNFSDIYKVWSLSTKRLISPRYMRAGMSDGGGCHIRDNLAMSWLAREEDMSHDLWGDLMKARESYETWHAEVAIGVSDNEDLPLVILGTAFKPETDIETGSAAILMANILESWNADFTHVNDLDDLPEAVYFIATENERYRDYGYPKGSVVLDPFGFIPPITGVEVIRLGRR